MIYSKQRQAFTISGGTYAFNTTPIRGNLEHLIVIPNSSTTVYDITIKDKDRDIIYDRKAVVGRLDDKDGLPIGWDTSEAVTIAFSSVTSNEAFTTILKVREKI